MSACLFDRQNGAGDERAVDDPAGDLGQRVARFPLGGVAPSHLAVPAVDGLPSVDRELVPPNGPASFAIMYFDFADLRWQLLSRHPLPLGALEVIDNTAGHRHTPEDHIMTRNSNAAK